MDPGLRATYRLQLRAGIGFAAAAALVPYLARLGVSHLYLSPILTARPGSTHGYDLVDFDEIDPVLGGRAGLEDLGRTLAAHGMGLLLDFVPNHMGVAAQNGWWWQQLETGERAPARFDIDWRADAGATPGRLLLPILGEAYGRVLAKGELELRLDQARGVPVLAYWEQLLPLAPASLALIDPELPALLARRPRPEAEIAALLRAASAPARLHPILEAQPWRLAHWRTAAYWLNYRRFFDITDLVGVRMEDPAVFDASHRLLLELVAAGLVHGVRLDHIDGLADPTAYLQRLQQALRRAAGRDAPFWVLVEKILGPGERLRADWPVAGTTGYEVLEMVAGPFTDPAGLARLTGLWRDLTGERRPFAAIASEAKRLVLRRLFPGELRRLAEAALRLAAADPLWRDLPLPVLEEALAAYVVALPVYRAYVDAHGPTAGDRALIRATLDRARADGRVEDATAFDFLEQLLLAPRPEGALLDLALRLQQLSGPAMAKAIEDTAFYRWHPLLALNEVGADPGHPPLGIEGFHAAAAQRLCDMPEGLLAGTTHDTKRGEDTRARLLVLSERAASWSELVLRCEAVGAGLVESGVPDAGVRQLILQTVVGIWPPGLEPDDRAGLDRLAERLAAYLQKALREAKRHTRWTAPDQAYEAAVERYARGLLDPAQSAPLLAELHAFARGIAAPGAMNGLAQTLLRLAMPGIPDIYQGSEGWELSLVDPDNRRPVDFAGLAGALGEVATADLPELLAHWQDGRVKQALIHRLLDGRRAAPDLFTRGSYRLLAAEGPAADRLLAFAREWEGRALIAVLPCRMAHAVGTELPLPDPASWSGTRLPLPPDLAGRRWRCRLGGGAHRADADGALLPERLLARFPGALLWSED